MKKLLLLFSFLTFLFSQQAEITNIQASQRTDGSQIVDITYDLLPDPVFEFFEISVLVSLDGGNNWSVIDGGYLQGDIGEIVEPGNGKTLVWDFGHEFGDTYSDQIKIKIQGSSYALVNNNNNQELPFELVSVTAGVYTFGENNETRSIDYDYEIMKYEVTDQDYVLFMMDKMAEAVEDGFGNCDDPIFCSNGYVLECDGSGDCGPNWIGDGFCDGNDQPYGVNFCCYDLDGGDCSIEDCIGSTDCNNDGFYSYTDQDSFLGYYPGDANYSSGNYTFLHYNSSKISWNGEIFEVEEGNVNHPVTGVTWFGAWAFATHYGMEIPDQYEWEKAARGNTGYDYPWGDEISNMNANFDNSMTTSSGSFNGTDLTLTDDDGYYEFSLDPNTVWFKNENNKTYVYLNYENELSQWTFCFSGEIDSNDGGETPNCHGSAMFPTGFYSNSGSGCMDYFQGGGSFFFDFEEPFLECDGYIDSINGGQFYNLIESFSPNISPYPSSLIDSFTIETIDSPSAYGAYDMAGNVWEIVKNDDDNYFIRGGAYNSQPNQLQSWYQGSYNGSGSEQNIGFRCMRIINQSQSRTVPKEKLKEYYLNKKNNTQKSNPKK
tara:strand:- start:681 stop:2486 length:1806 start_codon:yes stop_codon:yes gene_type:complete